MKVSIITTTYNAEKYIQETINSVLSQDFFDFEYLIIDDCSSDETVDVIQSYHDNRIVLYKNTENLWIVWSRNKWLQLAQGEYICFLDHDDIRYSAQKLSKQITYMDQHHHVWMVWSYCICFEWDKDIERLNFWITDEEIRSKILITNQFSTCSVMMRKKILDKVWYLNAQYEKVDDYDLRLRIWNISKFGNIPEFLVKYRYHTMNTTKQADNLKKMRKMTIALIQKYKNRYPNAWIGTLIQYILLYLPVHRFGRIRKIIFNQ